MDAYVDLSYIYSFFVIITIPYYFKRLLNVKVGMIDVISLGVFYLVLYFNAFLFTGAKWINILFLFLYFLLVYFKKGIKYFVTFVFCYYSTVAYSLVFSGDFYLYKGLIFISDSSSFYIVPITFVNIVIIEIVMLTIKKIKLLANYKMKVTIEMNDKSVSLVGYLDSGNTLIKDDRPVIFLNEKYMNSIHYKEMIVRGMGVKKCKYIDADIVINNTRQKVICAFVDGVGFKGCECLLNIHLLEEQYD